LNTKNKENGIDIDQFCDIISLHQAPAIAIQRSMKKRTLNSSTWKRLRSKDKILISKISFPEALAFVGDLDKKEDMFILEGTIILEDQNLISE
jgi:hypothetical protein